MKRKDVLLIALVLFTALALSLTFSLFGKDYSGACALEIRVNGAHDQTVFLGEADRVTVAQEDGSVNVFRVTENGFYMEFSSCKNQLCVKQGEVTVDNYASRPLGAHVICLPNRVDAYLVASDALEGTPDA